LSTARYRYTPQSAFSLIAPFHIARLKAVVPSKKDVYHKNKKKKTPVILPREK
jgi:hypothetical protein